MNLPTNLQTETRGAIGHVIRHAQGYSITNAWDQGKVWKALGARYEKDEAGSWHIIVPDLTTLIKCAAARGPLYVNREVAHHLAVREQRLAASRAPAADLVLPAPPGLEYLPFQRAGIAYASPRKATLIGDEMGLGKTIQALGVINASAGAIRSALVICPASLRLNWAREARKWLLGDWHTWIAADGSPCPAWASLAIINYDRLGRHPELVARSWDVVIVDEAHYLKNGKTKRAGAVAQLLPKCARKLFLTGTPLPNRPYELWPLVSALSPASFPSEKAFRDRYCEGSKKGASNLEELQDKMRAALMVRRLKRDVLKELPPKVRQIIELDPGPAAGLVAQELREFDAHQDAIEEARARVEIARAGDDTMEYKAAVAQLRECVGVAFAAIAKLRHATAVAKIGPAAEHVRGLFEGGVDKVLLFAHHRDAVHGLAKELDEFTPVIITGETEIAARQTAVDRFQKDHNVRLAVLSITAAGVGLTLTAAKVVCFAELDWVPANITQAEDRAHRIGQTDSVQVQHLVFDGSLDARMAKTLVEKQAIADAALDNIEREEVAAVPALPDSEPERQRAPKKWPPVGEQQRAAIHHGLRLLAGTCDGARSVDDRGFSKFDTTIGTDLARKGGLTDGQAWLGARLCRKYRRQLEAPIVEAAEQLLRSSDAERTTAAKPAAGGGC